MNNLSAVGNIGKDAELRYIPSGEAIANFSFALTTGYGDKQITTWLNCSLWGKRAESIAPFLTKGSKVGITGELTNRPYKTKDGIEKLSLELRVNDLTLLGSKQDAPSKASEPQETSKGGFDDFDQSIPF